MNYSKSHLHIAVQPVFFRLKRHIFISAKKSYRTTYSFFIVKCMLRKLSAKNILGKTKINILIYTTPILPLGRKKHKNIDQNQLRNPCDKNSAHERDAGRQFGVFKHRNISKHSAKCLLLPKKTSLRQRICAPRTTTKPMQDSTLIKLVRQRELLTM